MLMRKTGPTLPHCDPKYIFVVRGLHNVLCTERYKDFKQYYKVYYFVGAKYIKTIILSKMTLIHFSKFYTTRGSAHLQHKQISQFIIY